MNGEGADDSSWLTNWEQQCSDSVESQPDYEQALAGECEGSHKRAWGAFQDSATAIAQLYKDRYSGEPGAVWVLFQTAAGTVTSLYKESCESLKKSTELARQSGYQKRNMELLHWAKRKRTLIRREDLLTYLAGKPPPPRQTHHHHHHHGAMHHLHHLRLSPRPARFSPPPSALCVAPPPDPELRTFREALSRPPDLCAFIAGEMDRHLKRPASPGDVPMGSPPPSGGGGGGGCGPAHKRARYT